MGSSTAVYYVVRLWILGQRTGTPNYRMWREVPRGEKYWQQLYVGIFCSTGLQTSDRVHLVNCWQMGTSCALLDLLLYLNRSSEIKGPTSLPSSTSLSLEFNSELVALREVVYSWPLLHGFSLSSCINSHRRAICCVRGLVEAFIFWAISPDMTEILNENSVSWSSILFGVFNMKFSVYVLLYLWFFCAYRSFRKLGKAKLGMNFLINECIWLLVIRVSIEENCIHRVRNLVVKLGWK